MEQQSRLAGTRTICWLVIFGSALSRLLLLNGPELLPEEAYYWKYSVHLAPGYLDHPPLNAWLIYLGTALFGLNEFAVRFGSWLCGLLTLVIVYRMTKLLYGKQIALLSAALLSALPYYLGNSFYISPDAGLTTAWVAAVYLVILITRAPMEHRSQWMWWGLLGVSFGVGMLSKYSISLLAVAAAIYFLTDSKLRRWLTKPQPYVALLITACLFSPVIYWNATNEWASFAFQSTRRFSEPARFGLLGYIGQLLLLPTPVGTYVTGLLLASLWKNKSQPADRRLLIICNGLALVVFFFSSLKSTPRLNWTGPSFVGLAPLFAVHFAEVVASTTAAAARWKRAWTICLAVSLIGFVGFWTYGAVGFPGVGYSVKNKKLIGWEDLGGKILEVSKQLPKRADCEPVVIGMDKHYTAAELAFYVQKAAVISSQPWPPVAGRAVVGLESLMFRFWVPEKDFTGCDAVLVSRNITDLSLPEVSEAFADLDPVNSYRATRNGKPAGEYFYRIARSFRGKDLINHLHDIQSD